MFTANSCKKEEAPKQEYKVTFKQDGAKLGAKIQLRDAGKKINEGMLRTGVTTDVMEGELVQWQIMSTEADTFRFYAIDDKNKVFFDRTFILPLPANENYGSFIIQ